MIISRPNRSRLLALLLSSLSFALPSPCRAEGPSAEEKAAARELAIAGIELAQAGNCADAIDPLSRAEQLFHAPTILTWIGDCQIRLGKLVEGSETLREVIRENLPEDAPEAFLSAQKQARALIDATAPRIGRLNISVRSTDGKLKNPDQLRVEIDGAELSLALVGAPRPTDPGEHTIKVSLTGYETQITNVLLSEGDRKSVTIALTPNFPAQVEEKPIAIGAGPDEPSTSFSPSPWGWALVGGGAAFLAGGGALGYLAVHQKGKLDCPSPSSCPKSEEDVLNKARLFATLSTVSFAVGGAALVGGIVVLVVTGSDDQTADNRYFQTDSGVSLRPEVGWGTLGVSGLF